MFSVFAFDLSIYFISISFVYLCMTYAWNKDLDDALSPYLCVLKESSKETCNEYKINYYSLVGDLTRAENSLMLLEAA